MIIFLVIIPTVQHIQAHNYEQEQPQHPTPTSTPVPVQQQAQVKQVSAAPHFSFSRYMQGLLHYYLVQRATTPPGLRPAVKRKTINQALGIIPLDIPIHRVAAAPVTIEDPDDEEEEDDTGIDLVAPVPTPLPNRPPVAQPSIVEPVVLTSSSMNLKEMSEDPEMAEAYLEFIFNSLKKIYALRSISDGRIVRDGSNGLEGSGAFTRVQTIFLVYGKDEQRGVLFEAGILMRLPGPKGAIIIPNPDLNVACRVFEDWYYHRDLELPLVKDQEEIINDEDIYSEEGEL